MSQPPGILEAPKALSSAACTWKLLTVQQTVMLWTFPPPVYPSYTNISLTYGFFIPVNFHRTLST